MVASTASSIPLEIDEDVSEAVSLLVEPLGSVDTEVTDVVEEVEPQADIMRHRHKTVSATSSFVMNVFDVVS